MFSVTVHSSRTPYYKSFKIYMYKASCPTCGTAGEMLKTRQEGLLTRIKVVNHTSTFVKHIIDISVVSIKQSL